MAHRSMLSPYTQEDYYRIIHRREVQGKASRKAALGGRTTLQLDSDLEEEFLKSSSDDEDSRARQPARYNPNREFYATLAGVKQKLFMDSPSQCTAFADPYAGIDQDPRYNGETFSPVWSHARAHATRSVSPTPRTPRYGRDKPLPSQPTNAFMSSWRARRAATRQRSTVDKFLIDVRVELENSSLGSPPPSPRARGTHVQDALGEALQDAREHVERSQAYPPLLTTDWSASTGSNSASLPHILAGYTLVPTHMLQPPATPTYFSGGYPAAMHQSYPPRPISPAQVLSLSAWPPMFNSDQAPSRSHTTPQGANIQLSAHPPGLLRHPEPTFLSGDRSVPFNTTSSSSSSQPRVFPTASSGGAGLTQPAPSPPSPTTPYGVVGQTQPAPSPPSSTTPYDVVGQTQPPYHHTHSTLQLQAPPTSAVPASVPAPQATPAYQLPPTQPSAPHSTGVRHDRLSVEELVSIGQAEGGVHVGQSYQEMRAGQEEMQRALQNLSRLMGDEQQRLASMA